MEEGEHLARKKIILRMLAKGIDMETIADTTGLSLKEVKDLTNLNVKKAHLRIKGKLIQQGT